MPHKYRVTANYMDLMSSLYPNLPVVVDRSAEIVSGTSADQADSCAIVAVSVAGSGTQTVDFTSITGAAGQTISFQEIHSLILWTDTAGLELRDGGSNPWDGFGADYAIPVGTAPFVWCKPDGKSAGGGANTIDLVNGTGSTVTGTLIILGRD